MSKIKSKGWFSELIEDKNLHLITKQTMSITYVDDILTCKLLDG